jgi:hypothetical protein
MRAHSFAWALWVATVSLVVGALVLGLANRPVAPRFDVPLHNDHPIGVLYDTNLEQ